MNAIFYRMIFKDDQDFRRFLKISLPSVAAIFLPAATASFAQTKKTDSVAAPPAYQLRQGDKLSVKLMRYSELNEASVTVRPDGFINLQLIDDVKAEGSTVAELKSRLEKVYDEILINPEITVALLEFVQPRVFIGGQVTKPGRYDLRDGKMLVEVIFLAGGFTGDANRKSVLWARPDGKGDWEIQAVDVMQILNLKKKQEDLPLRDGDYIFVPNSKMSRLNKTIETFRGLLPRFL